MCMGGFAGNVIHFWPFGFLCFGKPYDKLRAGTFSTQSQANDTVVLGGVKQKVSMLGCGLLTLGRCFASNDDYENIVVYTRVRVIIGL